MTMSKVLCRKPAVASPRMQDTGYWDAVAAEWHASHPQELWRRHSDTVNAGLLRRWLPPRRSNRILKTDAFDEAFGDGLYPLLASRSDATVTLDISISALHAARGRHDRLAVCAADARVLPFAEEAFDVIVSTSTLDHFDHGKDIVLSLHEMHRVLKAGGRLILTLDNPLNPLIAVRNMLPFRMLNRLGLVPYYVGATCGPRALRRIMREVGFDLQEMTAVMHCPRVIAVPLASLLSRYTAVQTQRRVLSSWMALERLAEWPTRFLTGHFVAVLAVKAGTLRESTSCN
jgi:SAM-dependent methyltransferase